MKDEGHGLNPLDDKFDGDTGYFLQSLSEPRAARLPVAEAADAAELRLRDDASKRYDERLRMPKFPFDEKQREAVMTFVLGLTNEAPAAKYIYKPSPRQKAIVEGRHVLEKYNCAGCHILDMDRWDIAFRPNQFEAPPTTNDYPFVRPDVTPDQIKASLTADRRGLLHAELHGMPVRDEKTGEPQMVDQEGVPIEPDDKESARFYEFMPYQPAIVGGNSAGGGRADAANSRGTQTATGRRAAKPIPGHGGDLAKYLYPRVIAEEKKNNPNVVATEAWGWLPPPLHHEGESADRLAARLPDGSDADSSGRRAADAELPHVERRGEQAGRLLRGQVEFGVPVRVQQSPPTRLPGRVGANASGAAQRRDEDRHGRQLLREVPLAWRLPGEGLAEDAWSELGRGLSTAAARLFAAVDRQSAAHLAVHRHAGEHTV